MKTDEDYKIQFEERMAIMMENGSSEDDARIEATYEVRQALVSERGLGFGEANIKVMGIRKHAN